MEVVDRLIAGRADVEAKLPVRLARSGRGLRLTEEGGTEGRTERGLTALSQSLLLLGVPIPFPIPFPIRSTKFSLIFSV